MDARERSESKKLAATQAADTEATKGDDEETGHTNGAAAKRRRRKKKSSHSASRVRSHSLNSTAHSSTATTAVDSHSIAASHASTRLLEDPLADASEEDEVDTTVSSEDEQEAWNAEEVAYREEMLRKQRAQLKPSTAPVPSSALGASVAATSDHASQHVGTMPITPVVHDLANVSDVDPMAAVAQPLAVVAAQTIQSLQ